MRRCVARPVEWRVAPLGVLRPGCAIPRQVYVTGARLHFTQFTSLGFWELLRPLLEARRGRAAVTKFFPAKATTQKEKTKKRKTRAPFSYADINCPSRGARRLPAGPRARPRRPRQSGGEGTIFRLGSWHLLRPMTSWGGAKTGQFTVDLTRAAAFLQHTHDAPPYRTHSWMQGGVRRNPPPLPPPGGLPSLTAMQLVLLTMLRGGPSSVTRGGYAIYNLGIAQFTGPEPETSSYCREHRARRFQSCPHIYNTAPPAGHSLLAQRFTARQQCRVLEVCHGAVLAVDHLQHPQQPPPILYRLQQPPPRLCHFFSRRATDCPWGAPAKRNKKKQKRRVGGKEE